MNTLIGDAVDNGSSGTDKTLGGTITDSGVGALLPPCALIGYTTRPSIAALDSSRVIGAGDTADSTGDTGYARFFGGSFAYMNYGISGDTMAALFNSSSARQSLARLCSHLWVNPGLNDFNLNSSAASLIEYYVKYMAGLWPYQNRVIINDEGPWTTSIDHWATTGNQTAKSWESSRVALNTFVDALTGYNQIVRVAALDTASGSSFAWKNNGTANAFTPDGIHEKRTQLLALLAANAFNPSLIRF